MKKLLATLTLLVLLAACGIQPTPVIPAGPAPQAAGPDADRQLTLYFAVDGSLTPVVRHWGSPVTPDLALAELFLGPTPAEQKTGLYSFLPTGTTPATVDTTATPPTVTVPYSVKTIYLGLDQIVCTTVAALSATGHPTDARGITVTTPDFTFGPTTCTF
ncbi:hypothetical protein [Amycolatopsis sp. NPDC051903]|uniref:hypothetical protein n=1 Tax=Amycolatopsis sp. NPDC051903 TaxID=3363936 RepID=UPI0037911644